MKIGLYIVIALGLGIGVIFYLTNNQPSSPSLSEEAQPSYSVPGDDMAPSLTQTSSEVSSDIMQSSTIATPPSYSIHEKRPTVPSLPRSYSRVTPLPQRMVLTNQDIPYEVTAPEGWKLISPSNPVELLYRDQVRVQIDTGPWVTSQSEFADIALRDALDRYPHLSVESRDSLLLDGKRWQLQVLRSPLDSKSVHEVSLITYGSRRGSYRILIDGELSQLRENANAIGDVMASFRFPPDNFVPPNADNIRVYIGGERVEY